MFLEPIIIFMLLHRLLEMNTTCRRTTCCAGCSTSPQNTSSRFGPPRGVKKRSPESSRPSSPGADLGPGTASPQRGGREGQLRALGTIRRSELWPPPSIRDVPSFASRSGSEGSVHSTTGIYPLLFRTVIRSPQIVQAKLEESSSLLLVGSPSPEVPVLKSPGRRARPSLAPGVDV